MKNSKLGKLIIVASILSIVPAAAFGQGFDAGRPIRQGDRCWTVTDPDRGFGYWDRCAGHHRDFPASVSQQDHPSGGNGGGNGGGGQ